MFHSKKKEKEKEKETQHNMCWTPLCAKNANSVNKTWYLLQTSKKSRERYKYKTKCIQKHMSCTFNFKQIKCI